jgi:hypothetical protein
MVMVKMVYVPVRGKGKVVPAEVKKGVCSSGGTASLITYSFLWALDLHNVIHIKGKAIPLQA